MNIIPSPTTGGYSLLIASSQVLPDLFETVALLARSGPLFVLDGGNVFNAYRLARPLRRGPLSMEQALQNVHLGRAFTCYQVASLLDQPAGGLPILVLDMLSTFLDESVPLFERHRVLTSCAARLSLLGYSAPCAVWVRAGRGETLLPPLLEAASQVTHAGVLPPPPTPQPALF